MDERDDQSVLAKAWRISVLLKRDIFSTIECGHFRTAAGEVEAVLRRLDEVPWREQFQAFVRRIFHRQLRKIMRQSRHSVKL